MLRTAAIALLCLAPTAALAGDVWMVLEDPEDGATVRLELPATWMLDDDTDFGTRENGQPFDLAAEIGVMVTRREGTKRMYVLLDDDGTTQKVTLENRKARKGKVDTLYLNVADGLSFTLPLDEGKGLFEVAANATGIDGRVRFDSDLSTEADLDVLRRAGPTTLFQVIADDGSVPVRMELK